MSRPDPADTAYWDIPVEGECVGCGDIEDLDPNGLCTWCSVVDDDEPVPQVIIAAPLEQYL